jgi:hypothetical protein
MLSRRRGRRRGLRQDGRGQTEEDQERTKRKVGKCAPLCFPSPACGGGLGRGPWPRVHAVELTASLTLPRNPGRGKAAAMRRMN